MKVTCKEPDVGKNYHVIWDCFIGDLQAVGYARVLKERLDRQSPECREDQKLGNRASFVDHFGMANSISD